MTQEQIEQAKKLIAESKILSSLEKAEWLQLLPEMDDKQILELTKILLPKVQAQPVIQRPAAPLSRPQQNPPRVDITQKEISSSVPFYEKELPAPAPAPNNTPAMPTTSPQQLIQKQSAPKEFRPQPTIPAMAPAPIVEPSSKLRPGAAAPADIKLEFKSIDDFIKLSPNILRGKDPYQVLQKILNSVADFAKARKGVAAIYGIERSPLYLAYVDYGMNLLNQSPQQRELNQQEFEAFADFRKELDKLVI